MFAELVDSARELRNPLVIGYSILFTMWIWLGTAVEVSPDDLSLAGRLTSGFDRLGSASELALMTFAAAMVGSLAWNLGIRRLVASIQHWLNHPNWEQLISTSRSAVREYEEYSVTDHDKSTAMRKSHRVPSAYWSTVLQTKVDERVRSQSEIVFRVTLAVAVLPLCISLSMVGKGWWWFSWLVLLGLWVDIWLIRHSATSEMLALQLEDLASELTEQRRKAEQYTEELETLGNDPTKRKDTERSITRAKKRIQTLESDIRHRYSRWSAPSSTIYRLLQGDRRLRQIEDVLDMEWGRASELQEAKRAKQMTELRKQHG